MKILSINFGFNGSLSLLDDGKIIKHTSFNKINYGNDRNIIKPKTFSVFLEGTGYTTYEIDFFVFAGFIEKDFEVDEVAFVPDKVYEINPQYLKQDLRLSSPQVFELPTLNPPYTKKPYDMISGYFMYKDIMVRSYIISPDLSYNSYGYLTSNFTNSINITVNNNDESVIDGSIVSVSKGSNISIVNKPMISVGKLYPKMTELLGFGLGFINKTTLSDISTRYNIPENLEDIVDEGVGNMLSKIKNNYELNFFFQHSTSQFYQNEQRYNQIPYTSFEIKDLNSKYVLKTAAITQRVIENTTIKLIKDSIDSYSGNFTNNLTLSGTLFENRRLNTKILETFKELNIHISPYNGEESMSLGAAMYVNMIFGVRRIYNRDFILSTSPYQEEYNNLGDGVNYDNLSNVLTNDMVGYKNLSPECTEKSYGYTGIIFDVNSDLYVKNKEILMRRPFEKPTVVIKEESYLEYFNDISYTYNNNTLSKPKQPHLFKEFIHDDGYVNIFVVNDVQTKFLYDVLVNTNRDYIGHHDFVSSKNKHITHINTIFEICNDLEIKYILIDGKEHITK